MREFVKEVLPYSNNFICTDIPTREISRFKNIALNSLGLQNINQLRDKYEGSAFLQSFMIKVLPIIALEKHFKIELQDWDKLNPKNFVPMIYYKGTKVKIYSSQFGRIPLIDIENNISAIISMVREDNRVVWICGVASRSTLNGNQRLDIVDGSPLKKDKSFFSGFDKLKQFSSIDDLIRYCSKS